MSEWKEYRLSEIGTIVGGATPSTKNPSFYDGEIPWITPKDLTDWNEVYISRGERSITMEGYNSSSCKLMPKGTVLFTSRAPIGYIAIAANELCTNQGFKSVVPNKELVDSEFLYYALLYNKNKIKALGSGTTFAEISGKVMASVVISLPELATQKKIAAQLSEIDDKIAVNRRICENLEAQAQALFKHLFIDFAPFKNGKFVESELGMIPEGWRVGTFGEIVDLIKPSIKPQDNTKYFHYSIPAFDNNKFPSYDIGETIKSNKFAIYDSATLLSKLNPDHKRIWFVSKVGTNAICSTEFLPFYAKDKEHSAFVYCYLNSRKNYREIANGAKGTTNSHQRIDANAILSRKLAYNIDTIAMFCNVVDDFFKLENKAIQESARLSTLRDTLLPKLMSGQIKV